jgi:hypothetical protein
MARANLPIRSSRKMAAFTFTGTAKLRTWPLIHPFFMANRVKYLPK